MLGPLSVHSTASAGLPDASACTVTTGTPRGPGGHRLAGGAPPTRSCSPEASAPVVNTCAYETGSDVTKEPFSALAKLETATAETRTVPPRPISRPLSSTMTRPSMDQPGSAVCRRRCRLGARSRWLLSETPRTRCIPGLRSGPSRWCRPAGTRRRRHAAQTDLAAFELDHDPPVDAPARLGGVLGVAAGLVQGRDGCCQRRPELGVFLGFEADLSRWCRPAGTRRRRHSRGPLDPSPPSGSEVIEHLADGSLLSVQIDTPTKSASSVSSPSSTISTEVRRLLSRKIELPDPVVNAWSWVARPVSVLVVMVVSDDRTLKPNPPRSEQES